jgi:glycosyltransferase involved in cell wall biosynthesis
MRLVVSLPCLNEARTLPQVLDAIPRRIEGFSVVDLLVVDDGSTDGSQDVAKRHGAHVIRHEVNLGVGASFQDAVGFALAHSYDAMVTIDADGQFDPADIPRLMAPIKSGDAHFVSASRFRSNKPIKHMSGVKKWGNARVTGIINSLTRQKFSDVSCGYRAYSREALLRLNLQGVFTYTHEVFLSLAFQRLRIAEVPVVVRYFPGRQSRVASSISRYAVNTLSIIIRTYRDYRPLLFFSFLGLAFFGLGMCFLSFLGIWWLIHGAFTPHIWSGFVGAAFVFTAQILIVLGLIADMFVRIRKNQEELLYHAKKSMRP